MQHTNNEDRILQAKLRLVLDYMLTNDSYRKVAKRHGVSHPSAITFIKEYREHPWVLENMAKGEMPKPVIKETPIVEDTIHTIKTVTYDLISEAKNLNRAALRKLLILLETEKDINKITKIYEVSGNIAKLIPEPTGNKKSTTDAVTEHYLKHATNTN